MQRNDVLVQAGLTCGACELTQAFVEVEEYGETDIDLLLRRAKSAGWKTEYSDRDGYRVRCAECVEWEEDGHDDSSGL